MSQLNEYLKKKNIIITEGFSQQNKEMISFLKNIINDKSIIHAMEIGFNGGHSAELFLSSNKNLKLVSFDLGIHDYVKDGKKFIDKTFPNRHELILGNSLKTIPEYIKKNIKFDLIFIDGGHDFKIANSDLLNCKNLAHKNTIVIMDDYVSKPEWVLKWNKGPNKAWNNAKKNNIIKELGSKDYSEGRGQSWGNYLF